MFATSEHEQFLILEYAEKSILQ